MSKKIQGIDAKELILPGIDLGVRVLAQEYDSEVVNKNIKGISTYAKGLIPVALGTMLGYFIIPPIAGAFAFAAVGTSVSLATYSLTNCLVLGTGALVAADKTISIADKKLEK